MVDYLNFNFIYAAVATSCSANW